MQLFNVFKDNDHLATILTCLYTNPRCFLNGSDFKKPLTYPQTLSYIFGNILNIKKTIFSSSEKIEVFVIKI